MAHYGFTPARKQDIFNAGEPSRPGPRSGRTLGGEEARHFYENVIKDDRGPDVATSGTRDGRGRRTRTSGGETRRGARRRGRAAEMQRARADAAVERRRDGEQDGNQGGAAAARETSDSERILELKGLRFLRCAQEGDLPGLRDLLSKGVDINFQDPFFWTALMCASWSGQRAAVRLLLQGGAAWVGVVDTQGRDAKDLAVEAGHEGVLEELESFGRRSERDTRNRGSAAQPQWCDVCGSQYSSSLSSHLSSTLHQFSLRRPAPAPYYCLPPSANSYKMMVRSGWRPGSGLGPEGGGPQQPVPTVLKRDQEGLGYGRARRAKVTHFQAGDREAVKPPSKEGEETGRKAKRKAERQEHKDKSWERDFRMSFYL